MSLSGQNGRAATKHTGRGDRGRHESIAAAGDLSPIPGSAERGYNRDGSRVIETGNRSGRHAEDQEAESGQIAAR